MQDLPHDFALMTRNIALANCQNIYFNTTNDGENVNIRIGSYFRAYIKYKSPDVGLKNSREAIACYMS